MKKFLIATLLCIIPSIGFAADPNPCTKAQAIAASDLAWEGKTAAENRRANASSWDAFCQLHAGYSTSQEKANFTAYYADGEEDFSEGANGDNGIALMAYGYQRLNAGDMLMMMGQTAAAEVEYGKAREWGFWPAGAKFYAADSHYSDAYDEAIGWYYLYVYEP